MIISINHFKLSMIFMGILLLLQYNNGQQDFQFDIDDVQVQELANCSYNENRIMLSLILHKNTWEDIVTEKQERAIKILSDFLAIKKEHIAVENVRKRDINDIIKHLIDSNTKQFNSQKKLGKMDFMIGCGTTYFPSGKFVSRQIGQQMKDGSINEISGLDFSWWFIWSKNVNNRVPRNKRNVPDEGSGEDYNYYDDDYDDAEMTDVPILDKQKENHQHRHHHGDDNIPNIVHNTLTKPTDSNARLLESVVDNILIDKLSAVSKTETPSTDKGGEVVVIDPIIQDSLSKLESDITKTIENNNKLKDFGSVSGKKNVHPFDVVVKEEIIEPDEDSIEIKEKNDYIITTTPSNLLVKFTANYNNLGKDSATTEYTTIKSSTKSENVESTIINSANNLLTTTFKTATEESSVDVLKPPVSTIRTAISEEIPLNTHLSSTLSLVSLTVTTATTPYEASTTTTQNTTIITIESNGVALINQWKINDGVRNKTTSSDDNDYGNSYDGLDEDVKNTGSKQLSTQSQSEGSTQRVLTNSVVYTTAKNTSTLASTITTSEEINTTSTPISTSTTTAKPTSTEFVEPEPLNYKPTIKNRLPKQQVTAGKPFSLMVPTETFYDTEDGTNLQLELLDKNENVLKANSWIQFNPERREIYGLPLEDAVSKWQFKLRATDNANESVYETIDISVQQHKSHRSFNHEISIGIKLMEKFASNIDWQISLIKGIVETLGDNSMSSIVAREIRHSTQDLSAATFIYTNDTLPKDKCPDEKLEELIRRLSSTNRLLESVKPDILVKSIAGKPIGQCHRTEITKSKISKPTPHITKNYPPVPRNQVDRINATVGQLLVFKVPVDTFYDPEDNTDLKLFLLSVDRTPLDPRHWLQFDEKNQEFFGIPKYGDVGQQEYLLVAEDREGLTAADALVVVVNHPLHREYNSLFEMTLGMQFDEFNNSAVQRRYIERIAQIFGDVQTSNIQIRAIRKIHPSGKTMINYYNTTLHRPSKLCPNENIEQLQKILVHPDGTIRTRTRETLGNEFDLQKIHFSSTGACALPDDSVYIAGATSKPDDTATSSLKDDFLLTFVLPGAIIIFMLLVASIIACVLHRRRMTGKMELGDEEESRSFRSKGIPVIFQDELDEKLDVVTKSPIILKDEKPPLLPPSYNSTNPDDHEDLDEYIPPPAVVINGREIRGKSPVTPSYRKPPPYVSP